MVIADITVDTKVNELPGVGSKRAAMLENLDIKTVGDLLMHYPRAYQHRGNICTVKDAPENEYRAYLLTVGTEPKTVTVKNRITLTKFSAFDDTGRCGIIFFNSAFVKDIFHVGGLFRFWGKIVRNNGVLIMTSPAYEPVTDGSGKNLPEFVPIYPLTEGITQKILGNLIKITLSLMHIDQADDNCLKNDKTSVPSADIVSEVNPNAISAPAPEQTLISTNNQTPTEKSQSEPPTEESSSEEIRYKKDISELNAFETLPLSVIKKYNLCSRAFAIRAIHNPQTYEMLERGRTRLIFDELYIFTLGISLLKKRRADIASPKMCLNSDLMDKFYEKLPFKLTSAQDRTVIDIIRDLCSPKQVPMNRIVIGDVGSGKTVCAEAAAYIAAANGFQTAFMVPTEILAVQHYKDLSPLFDLLGIKTVLLTGSMKSGEKRAARNELSSGTAKIAIGTHALISESTEFYDLGLVITDEQHRFGILQRSALADKKSLHTDKPHGINTLVMSATPIPRTLALTMFGDLNISIIDELPPGRQKVDTFVVNESYRERLEKFILKQVSEGHQVYAVCPSIDGKGDEKNSDAFDAGGIEVPYGISGGKYSSFQSEAAPSESPSIILSGQNDREANNLYAETQSIAKSDGISGQQSFIFDFEKESIKIPLKNAEEYAENLCQKYPSLRVGLVHGKLSGEEKDRVMSEFSDGKIDVLISTTVIEVGVNVPNATLMIVENAERFGLSQLHQLRGRVGRGKCKSYCVLVSDSESETAKKRLNVIKTNFDGYSIAKQDLELRGPGDFFISQAGDARQHGNIKFKLAGLCGNDFMLQSAFEAAKSFISESSEAEIMSSPAYREVQHMFDLNSMSMN